MGCVRSLVAAQDEVYVLAKIVKTAHNMLWKKF